MKIKAFTARLDVMTYQTASFLAKQKDVSLSDYVREAVSEKNNGEAIMVEVEATKKEIKESKNLKAGQKK